jgi:hypothetical protein
MMGWCHGIFEMFCSYSYAKDKETEMSEWVQDEEGNLKMDKDGNPVFRSLGISPNCAYIDAKRPEWCEKKYPTGEEDMTPHPDCWMEDCKFLGTCPVEYKEYMVMMKAWEDACERGEFEDLDSVKTSSGEKEKGDKDGNS